MYEQLLKRIDIENVCDHYKARLAASERLKRLLKTEAVDGYCRLALGITDSIGNFSASEHKLGPRILSTPSSTVFALAEKLNQADLPHDILASIYQAQIRYLKISVGSEMAMMLQPERFWVANVRSVWAHLLVFHDGSYSKANTALALYRDADRSSEMDYKIWRDIYQIMRPDLVELGEAARIHAAKQKMAPTRNDFLWCDAVANELYAQEHE